MDVQYKKKRHEEFVSNLIGGDVFEIYSLMALSTLCFVFSEIVWRKSGKCRLLLDFLVGVIPIVLTVTALSDHIYAILIIVVICIFGMKLLFFRNHIAKEGCIEPLVNGNNRSVVISDYRGICLLITSICILAVDFNVFPRRFAKTETYGTGFMDIGVGGFVFMLGMVTHEARGLTTDFQRCFLKTGIPLLVLGFIRLMTIKCSNYQEHITEYGLHWNFFFTMFFVKLISTLLLKWFRSPPKLAIACTILHEFNLRVFLTDWILNAQRESLFSSNKEGIGSILGYVSLFFWGLVLGQQINMDVIKNDRRAPRAVLFSNAGICLGYLLMKALDPVSRRMANGAYVGWTVSVSSLILSVMTIMKTITFAHSTHTNDKSLSGYHSQSILEMYNSAAMFFFLISNLCTGLINMLADTLLIPNSASVMILVVYQAVMLFIVKAYTKNLS